MRCLPFGVDAQADWSLCYNAPMSMDVKYRRELSEEEKKLAECARAASRDAVKAAFAAGLSITIARGKQILRVAPDGTETVIGEL